MNFARARKHNMYIYFYNSCFRVTNQLIAMEDSYLLQKYRVRKIFSNTK